MWSQTSLNLCFLLSLPPTYSFLRRGLKICFWRNERPQQGKGRRGLQLASGQPSQEWRDTLEPQLCPSQGAIGVRGEGAPGRGPPGRTRLSVGKDDPMGQIGKQKVPRKKVEKVWQLFTTEKKKMLYKNFIAHSHDQWLQCESGLLFSYQKMPASLGEYGSAFEELHPHHDRVNAPLTMCVCVCSGAQSCQTLCDPMDCSPPGSFDHGNSPGKNTGVGCHALVQEIFLIQGLNQCFLHEQADSLPFDPPRKPFIMCNSWSPNSWIIMNN